MSHPPTHPGTGELALSTENRQKVTAKLVLSGHSNIDKTKVLKTNGRFMKVESFAECSRGAFCDTFDLHQGIIGLENHFLVFFFEWPLKTGFSVGLDEIYQLAINGKNMLSCVDMIQLYSPLEFAAEICRA